MADNKQNTQHMKTEKEINEIAMDIATTRGTAERMERIVDLIKEIYASLSHPIGDATKAKESEFDKKNVWVGKNNSITDIIDKRISDAFSDGCHNHEHKRLQDAKKAIKELIPPSYLVEFASKQEPSEKTREGAIEIAFKKIGESSNLIYESDCKIIVDALIKAGYIQDEPNQMREAGYDKIVKKLMSILANYDLYASYIGDLNDINEELKNLSSSKHKDKSINLEPYPITENTNTPALSPSNGLRKALEAALKELKYNAETPGCLTPRASLIEQIESALSSPDKGEDKWIDVNKELPKENKNTKQSDWVLTIAGIKMEVKVYDFELKRWSDSPYVTVTHWQPLPSPPINNPLNK